MNICIYGAASDDIDPIFFTEAYELAYALGKAGHSLIFGGGDHGLMGAAARGFHDAGAKITSIYPPFFNQKGVLYRLPDGRIVTPSMSRRKQNMERLSDAFICLPGGVGTYDEFFEILTNKQFAPMKKPLIVYNIDHYYDPLLALIEHTVRSGFLRRENAELLCVCATPEEVFAQLEPETVRSDF